MQSIIHMTVEFHNFAVIKATTMPEWKKQGDKINFSKMHHFWRVTVALQLDNFQLLRTSLKDRISNYCLKFKLSRIALRVSKLEWRFNVHTPLCERYSAFNGISHKKMFAIFLPNQREFYQIILSRSQGRSPNKSLVKNSNVIWDQAFSKD